jgi:hypothetical protein
MTSTGTATVDIEFEKPGVWWTEKVLPGSWIPRVGESVSFDDRTFTVHHVAWSWIDGYDEPSVRVVLR